MPKSHAPSAFRALVRESKSGTGRSPAELAAAARGLPDPYYASLALISIALDGRLTPKDADKLAEESLAMAVKENRPWRKAELLAELCAKARGSRFTGTVSLSVIAKIRKIDDGKARAEAISGCVSSVGCGNAAAMLSLGIENSGFELESCKPVIKYWAESCPESVPSAISALETMQLSLARAKLLGYLHTQLQRSGSGETAAMEAAVRTALGLANAERSEALRYLASQSNDLNSLETVAAAVIGLDSPMETAALLATLAGSADKAGHRELALDWFRAGVDCLASESADSAGGILFNLAVGLKRLGEEQQANELFEKLGRRPEEKPALKQAPQVKPAERKIGHARHILVLFDTHEGGIGPVHLRMLARAAPLCIAYGLDMGLMEFPEKDLRALVSKAMADTNVGKGGRYLRELMDAGRITLFKDFRECDSAGLAVATTSHPAPQKSITLEAAAKLSAGHPGGRMAVIMGLGRKGLPKTVMDAARHHAEITGSNIPLETSTAMGIIAHKLGTLK
ncbi:MAG: DUF531 family protein [Thermoplasmata archaeon]|nr:DUF531 family protein [Thermoplasmata archaeon]